MTRLRDTTPRLAPGPDAAPSMAFTVPPWMEHAACGPETAEIFFPNSAALEASLDAIAICKTCPVRAECLAYAEELETGAGRFDTAGVWGGLTDKARRKQRDQTPRCRECGGPRERNATYCDDCRPQRVAANKRASAQRARAS